MKQLSLLLLVAASVFVACSNDAPADEPVYTGPVQEVNPDQISDSLIYLRCEEITQETDESTHFSVVAQVGTSSVAIGDIEDCTEISPENYEQYEIPAEALHAIGNEDRTLYIIRAGFEKVVVREGNANGDGTYTYRAISTFSPDAMSANPEINPADLVGIYAGQPEGSEQSWLLFVGMSNRMLTAQLFKIAGPVPPADQVMTAMAGAEAQILGNFQLHMTTLVFESSLGKGKFIQSSEGLQARIDHVKTPAGEPLLLTRIDQAMVN